MTRSAFPRVAALFFALGALAHAYRAVQAIPIQFGSTAIPIWVSWMVVAVGGALSVWGFRSRS